MVDIERETVGRFRHAIQYVGYLDMAVWDNNNHMNIQTIAVISRIIAIISGIIIAIIISSSVRKPQKVEYSSMQV